MTEEQTPYAEQCESTVSRALQYMPELEARVQQMVADFDKHVAYLHNIYTLQYEKFGALSSQEITALKIYSRHAPKGNAPEEIAYNAAYLTFSGYSKPREEDRHKSMSSVVPEFRSMVSSMLYYKNTRDDIHDDIMGVFTKDPVISVPEDYPAYGVFTMFSLWLVCRALGDGTLGMLNALWQEQHQSIADDARQEVLMLYIADSIPAVCELWQQPLSTAVPGKWAMPVHRANVTAALYDLDRFHRINEIVQQV